MQLLVSEPNQKKPYFSDAVGMLRVMNNLLKKPCKSERCVSLDQTTVLNAPLPGAGKSLTHGAALLIALISSSLWVLVTDRAHTLLHWQWLLMLCQPPLGGDWQRPFLCRQRPRASSALWHRTAQTLRDKLHPLDQVLNNSTGCCSNPSAGSKHNFQPSSAPAGNRHWLWDHCRKVATGTSNPWVLVGRAPTSGQDRIQATHCLLEEIK